MDCPHCHSTQFSRLQRKTNLGYQRFRCKSCHRTYNERTGTPFNFIEVPTDILFEVLLSRLRYKLSYRDVSEFFLIRGFVFSHETVRDWEERFLPHFTEQIRTKRKGQIGKIWLVDETYIRVAGQWCYLYRGIDRNKHRYYPTLGFGEFEAAQRFGQAVDEVSNFLRPRTHLAELVSLSERRTSFLKGVAELKSLFQAA